MILDGDPGVETNGPSAPGRLKAELLGGPIPVAAPVRLILAKLELILAIGSTCGTCGYSCPPCDDELNPGSMPLCRRTPGGGCRGLVSNRLQLPTIVRMDSDKS